VKAERIGGEREGNFMDKFTNSVVVHPQLSNNRHPVDGTLVGAGSKSNN
jgi:hypothetical protein